MLGGTFNPPHIGHLALAHHARAQLGLQRVLLMPANSSPFKHPDEDPGARHRLRMCELATAGEEGLEACAVELARESPSYTVETLEQLRAAHPGVSWTFIAGADTARTLPAWCRPADLLALARLAVALREGSSREEVSDAVSLVRPGANVSFIEMPRVAASSSQVRERIARGEPVVDLVGEQVARYIEQHGLYEPRGAARAS